MIPTQYQPLPALAREIADATVLAQAPYWFILLGLTLICTAGGAWLGAYFAKSGELKAVANSFEALKRQLAQNTETVETIKTDIAHDDWVEREYKSRRRQKLEELVAQIPLAVDAYHKAHRHYMFEVGEKPDGLVGSQVVAITKLYFPELTTAADSLYFAGAEYVIASMKAGKELADARLDQRSAVYARVEPGLLAAWKEVVTASSELMNATLVLAPQITGAVK